LGLFNPNTSQKLLNPPRQQKARYFQSISSLAPRIFAYYYNAYVNLLGYAALKVPLSKDSQVPVGANDVSLLRLVNLFNFSLDNYRDPSSGAITQQVLLKISEWTLKNFREVSPPSAKKHDVRLPFLETLLSFPELVSPGSTLEYLVRTTLLSRLRQLVAFAEDKTLDSMLSFFQLSPDFAKIEIAETGHSAIPSFLPKMLSDEKPIITEKDIELLLKNPTRRWHRNFSALSWPSIVRLSSLSIPSGYPFLQPLNKVRQESLVVLTQVAALKDLSQFLPSQRAWSY
jgi:hypothetical protein